MKILSISIGGFYVRMGIIDDDYNFIMKEEYRTNVFESTAKNIIKSIAEHANKIINQHDVDGVSLQFQGTINNDGIIVDPPKSLKFFKGIDLTKEFKKVCKKEVYSISSAISRTKNEILNGKLKNIRLGILINIGSSIDGGIVSNGKLINGNSMSVGQFGKQLLYGKPWENSISTMRLHSKISLIIGRDDFEIKDIPTLINENEFIFKEWDKWCFDLAEGLNNLIVTLNPDVIIISGGITNNDDFSMERIVKHLYRFVKDETLKVTRIELSNFNDTGAMLGGTIHFKEMN